MQIMLMPAFTAFSLKGYITFSSSRRHGYLVDCGFSGSPIVYPFQLSGLTSAMQRSTSSIQPDCFGVISECASNRRDPARLLTVLRACAIWSLLRNHQLGSSNGAPLNKAILVSLST